MIQALLLLGATLLTVAAPAPAWPQVHVGDRFGYRQTTTTYYDDGPHVDKGDGADDFRVLATSGSQIVCSQVSRGAAGYSANVTFSGGEWRMSSGKVLPLVPFLASNLYLGGLRSDLRTGDRWSFVSNESSVLGLPGPRTITVTHVDGDRVDLRIEGQGSETLEEDGQPELSSAGAPIRMSATFSASATFVGGVLERLTDVIRTTQDQADGPPQTVPIKVEIDRE